MTSWYSPKPKPKPPCISIMHKGQIINEEIPKGATNFKYYFDGPHLTKTKWVNLEDAD